MQELIKKNENAGYESSEDEEEAERIQNYIF